MVKIALFLQLATQKLTCHAKIAYHAKTYLPRKNRLPRKNLLTAQNSLATQKLTYRTKLTCHAHKAFAFDDKHSLNLTLFKLKFAFYVAQNA